MKFKRGQIITGASEDYYNITNSHSICKVITTINNKFLSNKLKTKYHIEKIALADSKDILVKVVYTDQKCSDTFKYFDGKQRAFFVNPIYFRKIDKLECLAKML